MATIASSTSKASLLSSLLTGYANRTNRNPFFYNGSSEVFEEIIGAVFPFSTYDIIVFFISIETVFSEVNGNIKS